MDDMSKISAAIISGDFANIRKLTAEYLEDGNRAEDILKEGLIKGMDIVGEKMQAEEMFIPEVLLSAKCMSEAVAVLKPHLGTDSIGAAGNVVIGTVEGDLHDIGKNLVAMMLESAGYNVTDIGVNATPEAFVKSVKDHKVNIVALSALLTTTMPKIRETISAIVDSGLRSNLKIMVGGAPVTKEFAMEVGSDGFAIDAGGATKVAKELMQK
jgi:5-methyltetrahydrofolate--homocysteine methyltransferase